MRQEDTEQRKPDGECSFELTTYLSERACFKLKEITKLGEREITGIEKF